jgi:DnaJ family protein B protein 4
MFQGEGDEMSNAQAQLIEFILEELPHDRFIREGDNLKTFAYITLDEALCGFSKVVSTLDGRNLKIGNQSVVEPGQQMRFPIEGMPNSKTGIKGDLIVEVRVKFPGVRHKLTDSQKSNIRAALQGL